MITLPESPTARRGERGLEVAEAEAVGDHRRDVEAGLTRTAIWYQVSYISRP